MQKLKAKLGLLSIGLLLVISYGCSDGGSPTGGGGGGGGGNQAPVLATIGSRTAAVGLSLAFTVTATDADGPAPTLTTSTLPSGASFTDNNNGTGSFSWTPTVGQIGVSAITFIASDTSKADSEVVNITVAQPVSYGTAVRPILQASCAITACHGSAPIQGGLNMGTATWTQIRAASGNVGGTIVVAGNASSSSLYFKTTANFQFGARMPFGGGTLSSAQQIAIRDWINQGALNN
ncbi:MAG: putative Ig domain-containing protein [candidate division Zixibacteria bacterium]|nr:putative Ig domain-containing protein [candidate division Zixibacteria bacterium]